MLDTTLKVYNCRDAYATLLCAESLRRELQEGHLTSFYATLVQPLSKVLVKLNAKGLWVDESKKEGAIIALKEEVSQKEEELAQIAGKPLNVNGDEFARFLYEELSIKPPSRTKKGLGRVDEATLKKVASAVPEVAEVCSAALAIRTKKKVISTFLEGAYVGSDGRVHPNYRIGPATGRLACRSPNFQNIPEGPARSIYCAPSGKVFVYADFSQIELRILAILAKDTALLQVFAEGGDIHDANARDLFAVPSESKVTSRQRFFAKMFVYCLNYGGTAEGLKERGAEMLSDIPLERIKDMQKKYMQEHPAIDLFRRRLVKALKREKKLTNAFGRPRIFFGRVEDVVKSGYNFPIQSSAADVMNTKLIQINNNPSLNSLVLQVHDSVMLEVEKEKENETKALLRAILEAPVKELDNYSFPAKIQTGECWEDFS